MSNYWEKRAAQRMYVDMRTAEEAAEDIRKLYRRASLYIQSQGQDIFEAFRRQTGLTEAEARYYLTHAKSPADIQAVIEFAKQIQDPVRRQEILNWLKASATQSRLARLATLHEAIDNLVPLLYVQELALHQNVYRKILQDSYLHKVFDIQQYSGFGKFVSPMDTKRIDKLMHMRWLGSNYSSRLWGNTQRLAKSLRDELMVSWLTGRPQLAAWRAIDAEFHKGQMAARRLVRTESNYLANQAHKEAYKDSGVDKYIYVATLDMKTSKICRSLDGKVFLVKNAQPGKNYPPMHPWCRSTTIAWIPDALLAKMKRKARDPVTGKNYTVPANMTYNEWYKKYVTNIKSSGGGVNTGSSITRHVKTVDFSDKESIHKILTDAERSFSGLYHEECITITADGKVWYTKSNDGILSLDGIESSMEGSMSYHNHPKELTNYSFGEEDVASFLSNKEAYAKASDDLYEYEMIRTASTKHAEWDEVFHQHKELVNKYAGDLAMRGEIDPDEDSFHVVVEKLAKEYSFEYKRKRKA